MSGHTPGPWDVTGCMFPDDGLGGVYYRLQAEGMDASGANARLIASAPELLEAAIYAVNQLAEGDEPELDADGNEIEPFERLRAAIARATGAA